MDLATSEESDSDLFTPEFKRLKARNPPPDLSGVLDLSTFQTASAVTTESHNKNIVRSYQVTITDLTPITGLKPCTEWKVFELPAYPGLIIIQNPFLDGYQRYWVCRCLQDFPSQADNVTNLSALGVDGSASLWSDFVHKKSPSLRKQEPLRKLRWTTLGYHYDWTEKEYTEDAKAEFPLDVNCLSQYLADCLGFGPYQAEAAIVNYYHLDSTLAGHTDHSEIDQSAPLFSISFGQTAIFLLGGKTKAVKPVSIYLRSGDICVMSGMCRLAYHAVPKILAAQSSQPIPACFQLQQVEGQFNNYFDSSCIPNKLDLTVDSKDMCNTPSKKQSVLDSSKDFRESATAVENVSRAATMQSAISVGNKSETTNITHMSTNAFLPNNNAKRSTDCSVDKVTMSALSYQSKGVHLDDLNRDKSEMNTNAHSVSEGCISNYTENPSGHVKSNNIDPNTIRTKIQMNETNLLKYRTDYCAHVEKVNYKIEEVMARLDFTPFKIYLMSARINMNVRQVLPWDLSRLPDRQGVETDKSEVNDTCHCQTMTTGEVNTETVQNLKGANPVCAEHPTSVLSDRDDDMHMNKQMQGEKKQKMNDFE